MSTVTGVMLCTGCGEEDNIQKVNSWLVENGYSALHSVDELCCNGKHPQMLMNGGGNNYFLDEPFVEFVMSVEWRRPEDVVLVLNPEHTPVEVHRIKGD